MTGTMTHYTEFVTTIIAKGIKPFWADRIREMLAFIAHRGEVNQPTAQPVGFAKVTVRKAGGWPLKGSSLIVHDAQGRRWKLGQNRREFTVRELKGAK